MRRGRPSRAESAALEDRVRAAAVQAFVRAGYEGATMEAIAATAGISKRTLYAKYADKGALFAAVVPRALAELPDLPAGTLPGDDLTSALRAFAHLVVARLVHPDAVRLRRLALVEAGRLPEAIQPAVNSVYLHSIRVLVELLSDYASRGDIVLDDVELAADQFLSLVAGGPTILADLGVHRDEADEAHRIDHAVDLFLRGVLPRSQRAAGAVSPAVPLVTRTETSA